MYVFLRYFDACNGKADTFAWDTLEIVGIYVSEQTLNVFLTSFGVIEMYVCDARYVSIT